MVDRAWTACRVRRLAAEADAREVDIHLSEVISALSYALNVTEGQPLRHAVRSCAIGIRIGEEVGLDDDTRSSLLYALLLKDAGCPSNAAKLSALFGASDFELSEATAEAIKTLDEHRDGAGYSYGLPGEDIPLLGPVTLATPVIPAVPRAAR